MNQDNKLIKIMIFPNFQNKIITYNLIIQKKHLKIKMCQNQRKIKFKINLLNINNQMNKMNNLRILFKQITINLKLFKKILIKIKKNKILFFLKI